jgi:hypothetical protein
MQFGTSGTSSAHKKWITALCSFFGANGKWTVQVYDTKVMPGMYFQGHICNTTVGDKSTTGIASCPTSSVTNCTICSYTADNF